MSIKTALGLNADSHIGTTASSPFTGSPTFDEVPFHISAGRMPALNSFVFITRDGDDIAHYGRITMGREENPRADPVALQQNSAYQIGQKDPRQSDRAPHVTRIMYVRVLGEVQMVNGEPVVREPDALPQTGKAVFEVPADMLPWLLNLPTDPKDGIFIGNVRMGKKTTSIRIPLEMFPRQSTILGKSGVGKSYCGGVIVEEAVEKKIPVLAFDILGDLVQTTEELGGKNFRAGRNFKVPYSIIGWQEFENFINLTRDQAELVSVVYDTIYNRAIDMLYKTGSVDIPIGDLLDEIEHYGTSIGSRATAGAVRRVRESVSRNNLLTEKSEDWINDLADSPVVNVFIGHLGQHQRSLIVGACARMLQGIRRIEKVPPFMLILDEAHLLLPSGEHTPSTAVLREMVRTARHDAVGVVLITQSPSSMDRATLLACNTRIIFALDREDLRVVAGTLGDMSEAAIARIPNLPRGTAIISATPEIMRHSIQVHIRPRRTTPGAPTPDMAKEVEKWRERRK